MLTDEAWLIDGVATHLKGVQGCVLLSEDSP